jgi:restriction endonuclease S subunit
MTFPKTKLLGELAEVLRGTTITRKQVTPGDVPVIAGGKTPSCSHNISNRSGETITVSASGAYAGYVQYFNHPIFASDCSTIQVKSKDETNTKYLYYALLALQNEIYEFQRGSGQPHVYPSQLVNLEIPVPPLPEQHRIVEILEDHLSRLDAALADVKQAKVKAAQFRRSLLQAAFTGNLGSDGTRLMTQIPNGWRTKTLKDWGMNISRLGKLDFESYKSVEDDSHRRIVKGDILFNNTNSAELVGKTTLIDIDGEFAYSNHMTRLRFPVEEVAHKYMSILLHSLWMSGYFNEICSNHVNQASVSIKRLEQVEVSLPPLPEQHRIVEILEDHLSRLDASIALADAMEKQSAGLRRSLLQAAFTGQLTKEVASV